MTNFKVVLVLIAKIKSKISKIFEENVILARFSGIFPKNLLNTQFFRKTQFKFFKKLNLKTQKLNLKMGKLKNTIFLVPGRV